VSTVIRNKWVRWLLKGLLVSIIAGFLSWLIYMTVLVGAVATQTAEVLLIGSLVAIPLVLIVQGWLVEKFGALWVKAVLFRTRKYKFIRREE